MDNVQKITDINWLYVFGAILLAIIVFCFVADAIVKFYGYIKKPMDWKKRDNEDHDTIAAITETLKALKEQQDTDRAQSIKHDNQIKEDLESLSNMVFDKNIEDMRWRILDFSSAISNGRKFNRESYDFVLKTYDQYEELLKKRNMTNGLVDETVKYIKNNYQERLKNGDF